MAAMGFDEPRLKTLNSALVYCNLSGFGSSGPYRDRPSFDFIAQAMSGFMSVTGEPGGPPMRAGPPIADLVAGLYGALGICAALVRRGRTNKGETVGASLNNSMISMLGFLAANYLATGEPPERSGNDHAIVSPYGMFRTRDGEIAIAPSQEQSYQRLIDALDMPEWRDDPRFRTNDLRVANRPAMKAAIEARLMTGTSDYWIEKLNAAGVPCDRVKTLPEVFADPQTIEQEMVISAAHPGHGEVKMLGFPIKFAQAPCRLRRPAPDLGADSDAVLREIGYSARGHRPTTRCRRGLKHSRSTRDRRHPPACPANADPAPRRIWCHGQKLRPIASIIGDRLPTVSMTRTSAPPRCCH